MRAIITGQIGMNKKPYVEAAVALAERNGIALRAFHVGDRMYAEAPDVRAGRVLDLPLGRLHTLRRAVMRDITAESNGEANVLLNTHATFRWRHGLFRAFDFDQIRQFKPDLFICLVDNIEAVAHRLHAAHSVDATLKDLMVWREEEIMATELLAQAVGCGERFYVMSRGRSAPTIRTLLRLVTRGDMKRVYPSFPMTHVAGMPDVQAEIDAFRAELASRFIAFDPGDVDEKLLLERAIEAVTEGHEFIEGRGLDEHEREVSFDVSVKQVLDIAGDIDGQIYARDFKLIDQSDMIVSLIPELEGGTPGLSSGVERELQHAFEGSKDVYVVWKPRKNPSPFITATATGVFPTTGELLAHLEAQGLIAQQKGLFGA